MGMEIYRHGEGVKLPSALLNAGQRWIPIKYGYEVRKDYQKKRIIKCPCDDQGYNADSFKEENLREYAPNRAGFKLSSQDHIVCVDTDNVPDKYYEFVLAWITYMMHETYVEPSISNVLNGNEINNHIFLLSKRCKEIIKSEELGIEIFPINQVILTTGLGNANELSYQEDALDYLIDTMHELALAAKESKKVAEKRKRPTNKPQQHSDRYAHSIAMTRINWHKTNNCPLIKDYRTFLRTVFALKSIKGFSEDYIDEFCSTQPGYDHATFDYIRKITPAPDEVQIANLIALSNEAGYPDSLRKPIERLPGEKQKKNDDPIIVYEQVEGQVGAFNDDVMSKPQLTPKLSACGDSVAVSGRSGGGKTTHVFSWMKQVQDMGMTNVLINADMNDWQIQEKCGEHGINLDQLVRVNIRGMRHIHIEQLICEIKRLVGDKVVGIICIDNTLATGLLLWNSINDNPTSKRDRWRMMSDDCAIAFHNKVIDRLANEYDCVVVFIGHPGKNSAGKDKFPGSEQFTAYAGLAYRIYRVNSTNVDEVPRSILKKFKDNDKPTKKWTLATVFKPRYPVSDYFLAMGDNGAVTSDANEDDDIDIDDVLTKGKGQGSMQEVNPADYIAKLREFLDDKRGEKFGFKRLREKMPNHPKMHYLYWVGLIVTTVTEAFTGNGSDELYFRYYNGWPVVFLTAPDKK